MVMRSPPGSKLRLWCVLALTVGAAIAIFRFKAGTIQTLAACSAAGIILYLTGLVAP